MRRREWTLKRSQSRGAVVMRIRTVFSNIPKYILLSKEMLWHAADDRENEQ